MAILQALADLGFADATIVGDREDTQTVRVRTSRGWVYEKFRGEEQVAPWARKHNHEVEQ